jgi:hypothetical protein
MENDEKVKEAIEAGQMELEDGTIAKWVPEQGVFSYEDKDGNQITFVV